MGIWVFILEFELGFLLNFGSVYFVFFVKFLCGVKLVWSWGGFLL